VLQAGLQVAQALLEIPPELAADVEQQAEHVARERRAAVHPALHFRLAGAGVLGDQVRGAGVFHGLLEAQLVVDPAAFGDVLNLLLAGADFVIARPRLHEPDRPVGAAVLLDDVGVLAHPRAPAVVVLHQPQVVKNDVLRFVDHDFALDIHVGRRHHPENYNGEDQDAQHEEECGQYHFLSTAHRS
jgi:hypothetical protein